jgi:hypothetical protein
VGLETDQRVEPGRRKAKKGEPRWAALQQIDTWTALNPKSKEGGAGPWEDLGLGAP